MVCSQTAGPPALLLMLLLNAVRRAEWFGTAAGNVRHHHHHYMETNVYRLFVDLYSTLTTLNIVVRMAAGRSSVCQPFHQCWKKDATKSGKNWTPLQGFTSAMRSTPKFLSAPNTVSNTVLSIPQHEPGLAHGFFLLKGSCSCHCCLFRAQALGFCKVF